MATALLKAGAAVTVTDVRRETLGQTSAGFGNIPGAKHLAVIADGTKDEDVNNAVQRTVDAFGRIDVLINNAQTSVTGINLEDQTVADVMDGIDSGFLASFRYMKACFPYLKHSQGTVINFASQAGLLGNWGMVGYNAAKEANRALTRTAAREWAQHNITVNCIIPGMLTEGSKEFFDANPEHYKHSLANIPLGRLGDPEKEAGALVVFLASDGAHYITGDTFNIDGGRCMRP
jgi:NAD(P)-dependent dehydrogenase (short-subunit alcohol dehydrogenase family)